MIFALGTAQFSNNYGILKKKISTKKIFDFVNNDSTIKLIDTAPAYSNSEKIIGKFLKRDIKITTKINPFIFSSTEKNLDKLKKDFDLSLKNLKKKTLYGLLFHKTEDIIFKNNDKIFYYLEELIKNNILKKIGFSTYTLEGINKYLDYFDFRIIQLPINIFNLDENYKKKLQILKKKYNLEIHARSVFLQGLGLMNEINNSKFYKLNQKLKYINKIADTLKISKHDILLSGITKNKFIDNIIIGCSSSDELELLSKFKEKKKIKSYLHKFVIKDKFINDPRKWPKNL